MKIGVLALQGAFREHVAAVRRLGVEAVEVRLPEQLLDCDGLILPGGETTTQRKLARNSGLWEPLRDLGKQGLPLLATCAGLIHLSRKVDLPEGYSREPGAEAGEKNCLGLLDVDVLRNAYGRQVFSFEALLEVRGLDRFPGASSPFPALFIRAPRITRTGPDVSVLGTWDREPVVVEQDNILALTFHPELTRDDRFHQYFLRRVEERRASPRRPGRDRQPSCDLPSAPTSALP